MLLLVIRVYQYWFKTGLIVFMRDPVKIRTVQYHLMTDRQLNNLPVRIEMIKDQVIPQ